MNSSSAEGQSAVVIDAGKDVFSQALSYCFAFSDLLSYHPHSSLVILDSARYQEMRISKSVVVTY